LFVQARMEQLLAESDMSAVVVSPVPWFPFGHPRFGLYGAFSRTPAEEQQGCLRVLHPRYPAIPKIGSAVAPFLMAAAVVPAIARLRASGYDFELIDAHYFYPDGVAAALLARHFDRPLVITARGSDLNAHAAEAIPRRLILWAARQAFAVVTVSESLRRTALALGMDAAKTVVLRNGVDANRFRPLDRDALRARLGLTGVVLLIAGNLVAEKGQDLAVAALPALPEATLLIAGDGPLRAELEQLAAQNGVSARVRFLGSLPQTELIDYYNAADLLLLTSTREGWPNVLLEAMACGTPAVAAAVGGCDEIITAPEAGMLLSERTPDALATTVRACLAKRLSRHATRRHAERFGWHQTSMGQIDLFHAAISRRTRMGGARAERAC
jgi:glycosyltransferase involved in cell wall biosynthesis